MTKAQDTLNSMLNHFNVDSIVRTYLESNCAHLLVAPQGNTGIPQSYFNTDNWTPELKQRLGSSYSKDITMKLSGKSGVYAMYSLPSNEFCIGSNTDFHSRLNNHYSDSLDPLLSNRLLYREVTRVGGFQPFL